MNSVIEYLNKILLNRKISLETERSVLNLYAVSIFESVNSRQFPRSWGEDFGQYKSKSYNIIFTSGRVYHGGHVVRMRMLVRTTKLLLILTYNYHATFRFIYIFNKNLNFVLIS